MYYGSVDSDGLCLIKYVLVCTSESFVLVSTLCTSIGPLVNFAYRKPYRFVLLAVVLLKDRLGGFLKSKRFKTCWMSFFYIVPVRIIRTCSLSKENQNITTSI